MLKPMIYKDNDYGLPQDSFRISPSSIAQFNDKKYEWYRSQVLGENPFEGNTSTFLGQCVHRVIEYFLKGEELNEDELIDYIDNHIINLDVDKEFIKEQYLIMAREVISHLQRTSVPQKSEEEVSLHINGNVYLAGTYDALDGDVLIDFKTTSRNNPPDEIPYNYKWQMLAYAYALIGNGIQVNSLRLIYVTTNDINRISDKTGKRLKDYPTVVKQLDYLITPSDLEFIRDYINLIAETYLKGIEDPSLVYLLYGDYRLKENRFNSPFN